ncbi:MAG: pyridoxamine 5'-phosphate oxidase family protein [Thermodesulfobacteriota bacterium]
MRNRMESLVRQQRFGVLATTAGDRPHCSLMAYVPDAACSQIYMVTRAKSKKFRNLTQNPNVSLLVDTRGDNSGENVQALTIEGVCAAIGDESKARAAAEKLLATHPQIGEFLADADSQLLCMRIDSFLLLDGLSDAYFERVS